MVIRHLKEYYGRNTEQSEEKFALSLALQTTKRDPLGYLNKGVECLQDVPNILQHKTRGWPESSVNWLYELNLDQLSQLIRHDCHRIFLSAQAASRGQHRANGFEGFI